MDVPQPLLDLGFDPATIVMLFAIFKDTLEDTIKKTLAESPMLDIHVISLRRRFDGQGTVLSVDDRSRQSDHTPSIAQFR